MNKICPDWRTKPDVPSSYKHAKIADASSVDILAHKAFELKIGNSVQLVPFNVIERASDILIGTYTMQSFQTNINLDADGIKVTIDGEKVKLFSDMEPESIEISNANRIVIKKNQSKIALFDLSSKNDFGRFEKGNDGIVFSDRKSISIVIPSLSSVNDNLLIPALLRNDSNKKIVIKKGSILARFSPLPSDCNIISLQAALSKTDWTPAEIPVKFFHCNPVYNSAFYTNPSFEFQKSVRAVKLQHNVADDEMILGDGEKEGIFEITHPLDKRDPFEIIRTDLETRLKGKNRDDIIMLLEKYSGIIATHNYDAGQMLDHKGDPILMKIPLKGPLPKLTKSYHLSESQQLELNMIFDSLIMEGIAKENTPYEQFGSPCFLIRRKLPPGAASNLHSTNRVIFDIRIYNQFVASATSTPSTCVQEAVQKLNNEAIYVTSLDLKNAYLALTLHPEALKSGVSNIYSLNRSIKFLRGLTGLNLTPIIFMRSLEMELDKDDNGKTNKLCDGKNNELLLWYDDLSLITKVSGEKGKELHLQLVERTLHRLHRMNLRISLRKCTFLNDLSKETMTVLGFDVGMSAIRPCKKKVDALLALPPPKNVKQAQSLLGSLNFLRNLSISSLRYGHLISMLSHLTSNVRKFEWTAENQLVFDEIKSILVAQDMNTFQSKKDTIKIIYSDSSEYCYGGLCFALNIDDNVPGLLDPIKLPESFRPLDGNIGWHEPLRNHCKQHNIALVPFKHLEDGNFFHTFFYSLLVLHNIKYEHNVFHNVSYFVKHILYLCMHKYPDLLTLCKHKETLVKTIFSFLERGEVDDSTFSTFFEHFLHILYISSNMNISLVFLDGKIMKQPFCNLTAKNDSHHFFLGFQNGAFFPLLLTEKFENDSFFIESNLERHIKNERDPKKVLDYFKRVMEDTEQARKTVKICKSFSKVIPDSQKSFPIYSKEAKSLILVLEHCRDQIMESPLTIALVDSKTSFWLFSSKSTDFCVKSARYALRLSLHFPNLFILSISGKQNHSDFLSRLSFTKNDFLTQTLTPVMVDVSRTKKYENKIFSLDELKQIANADPELLFFSDKKWKGPEINILYDYQNQIEVQESKVLDLIRAKNHGPRFNRVQNPLSNMHLFEKLFHRNELLKNQKLEFSDIILKVQSEDSPSNFHIKGDLLFFNKKMVMPTMMYKILVIKEHYLSVHSGKDTIEKAIHTIYHIVDTIQLKRAIDQVHSCCLPCLSVKPNQSRKQKYGIFHSGPGSQYSVQLDLIEDLPGLPKVHLLCITDLYSRYISIYVLRSKTSIEIIHSLVNYWSTYKVCKYLCTDNGSAFQSNEIQSFFSFLGIKVLKSQPYHPESRSLVERCNLTVQNGLKLFNFDSSKHFKYILPHVMYLLNSREILNSSLSAWELHHRSKLPAGYRTNEYRPELLLEYESMNTNMHSAILKERQDFEKCIGHIEKKILSRKLAQNDRINKHREQLDFSINDFVLVKDFTKFLGMSKKLRPDYITTPYQIFAKSKKGWGFFLENVVTGVQIYRHPTHLKKIKVSAVECLKIPRNISKICDLLTPLDLEKSLVEPILQQDLEVQNEKAEEIDVQTPDDFIEELFWHDKEVSWT